MHSVDILQFCLVIFERDYCLYKDSLSRTVKQFQCCTHHVLLWSLPSKEGMATVLGYCAGCNKQYALKKYDKSHLARTFLARQVVTQVCSELHHIMQGWFAIIAVPVYICMHATVHE